MDAALLGAFAAWAIAVPFAASAVGLDLGVALRLEIADHVIPGAVALAGGALALAGGGRRGSNRWLAGASVVTLAGLWITTTHVPLLLDALDGAAPVAASLLHASAGPPLVVLGLAMVLARPAQD